MLHRINNRIETKTCISKQYIFEQLFIITYLVALIFMYTMKSIILIMTFFFLMIVLIYIFYRNKRFNNIAKWTKVDANVLKSKVIKCICFTAYNALEQQRLRKEVYKPEIIYKYYWNKEEYVSNQYARSFDDVDCNFSYSKVEAQKIVNHIKRKKEIEIFVHEDTGESVITLDIAKGYGIPYVGMTVAGIMILFLVYKVYTYV